MDGSQVISEEMRMYCTNESVCRRKLLMSVFEKSPVFEQPKPTHLCCDICTQTCFCCDCDQVKTSAVVSSGELQTCPEDVDDSPHTLFPQIQQQAVIREIMAYWDSICQETPSVFGQEIVTCLPNSLISKTAKHAAAMNDVSDLLDLGVVSLEVAQNIFDIIQHTQSC